MKTGLLLSMASLCLAALTACDAPPAVEKAPRAVLVRSLDAGSDRAVVETRVYAGEVRARYEHDLAFRIGGKVIHRDVEVGDAVRRGEVLARLDPQDMALARQAAMAQVVAAEAELALARAELTRSESLRQSGFISASALDTRRTAVRGADARLRQARAQAETAANQADYAELRAAVDGVVVSAPVEAGQVVAAGQAVVRVVEPGEREVLIHVPESRIREFTPGMAALVRPWAGGTDLAGVVREVAPVADTATRSYAVRVSVADAGTALPLGATANVAFRGPAAGAGADGTVLLPAPAVIQGDGATMVWLVDEASQLRRQAVTLVALREDGALVRADWPARARVVVAGAHRLVEGEAVRPVAQHEAVALDVAR